MGVRSHLGITIHPGDGRVFMIRGASLAETASECTSEPGARMTIFHFELCRNGERIGAIESRDCPDCGMAFRAARDMIRSYRDEDSLPNGARDHTLRVTYVDHSLLFDLPFDLRI